MNDDEVAPAYMSEVELFFQHLDSFSIEMRQIFKEMNTPLIKIGENLDRQNSKLDQWSACIQASIELSAH